MDNRLNDALAFANYRLTLQIQRQNIEARVASALLLSHNGAIFKTTLELIAFVNLKVQMGGELRVEDQSGNVITIEDPKQFAQLLVQTYDDAMRLKQEEQQKLKSARSTAKIVGL
jgi:hypothetical protein